MFALLAMQVGAHTGAAPDVTARNIRWRTVLKGAC